VLTQPTQCDKLSPTVRLRTLVHIFLVVWALQVLVEPLGRLELGVAQETLVHLPIPRALCRPRRLGRRRLEVAQWPIPGNFPGSCESGLLARSNIMDYSYVITLSI
jgi:hypothetical protein